MKNNYYNFSDSELILKWGEKLKALRVTQNLSQNDLAKKTGMSRSSIAGIENGRNFSIISLISIARSLNFLEIFDFFLKDETYELTPMEIYNKEKTKRKRGGYNK